MSDNANQTSSRSAPEKSGNSGHFDQEGRRSNTSGNRNSRRRRPSPQAAGEHSASQSQRPAGNQTGVNGQQKAQMNRSHPSQPVRQDPNHPGQSNNRPQKTGQAFPSSTIPAGTASASANIPHAGNRSPEKPYFTREKQIPEARNDKSENQAFANRKNDTNQSVRTEKPREPRTWGRNIRLEETHEDIHRENERIEKEIWLEIAGIHTYKLD